MVNLIFYANSDRLRYSYLPKCGICYFFDVYSKTQLPRKRRAHGMMTKPRASTCHLEIRFLRMRDLPEIDKLKFYINLFYIVLPQVVMNISRK